MATSARTPATDIESTDIIPTDKPTLPMLTPEEEQETQDESIVARLRQVLGSGNGSNVYLRLYRVNPRSKTMDLCRRYEVDEVESDDGEGIRNEWGPGDYEFRVINSTGVAAKIRLSVAAPFNSPNPIAIPPTANREDALSMILGNMAQTNAAILAKLSERPNDDEATEKLVKMVALIKSIMPTSAPAVASTSSPMAAFAEMMEGMRMLRENARELAGEKPAGDPDDPVSMVREALPMIVDAWKNRNANPAPMQALPTIEVPESLEHHTAQQPRMRLKDSSEMNTETPIPPPTEIPIGLIPIEQLTMEQMMIRGPIDALVEMAVNNKSAEDGGAYIYDNIPDEAIPMLKNHYWFVMLGNMFPQVKPHEEWFRAAKAEADKLFSQPDDA